MQDVTTVQVATHHLMSSWEFDVRRDLFFVGELSAEHIVLVFVTKTAMNKSFSIWQLHELRHRLVNKVLSGSFLHRHVLVSPSSPLSLVSL